MGLTGNRLLQADAYTLGSAPLVAPRMQERSAYQLWFRRYQPRLGLAAGRVVFYGLGLVLPALLAPLTEAELSEASEGLARFPLGAGALPFDRALWERVVALGRWPVSIRARRDGAVVRPGAPLLELVSEPGFGEVAGHLEVALVQLWATSLRATEARTWLEENLALVDRCCGPLPQAERLQLAALQLSDFGARAASGPEEAMRLGMAHLTSHLCTDTVSAAVAAWRASAGRVVPFSLPALAHRVVLGHASEASCFARLFATVGAGGVASYVADTWDFEAALREQLLPLARRAAAAGGLVVVRPDSGDGPTRIRQILEAAQAAGLVRVNALGLRELVGLRFIYADELDFERIRSINRELVAEGWCVPRCGVYGVGSGLRDGLSRRRLSAVWKLCAVGAGLEPVAKRAPGKAHPPGLLGVWPEAEQTRLCSRRRPEEPAGALDLIVDRGRWTPAWQESCDFARVRERVLEGWGRLQPGPVLWDGDVQPSSAPGGRDGPARGKPEP